MEKIYIPKDELKVLAVICAQLVREGVTFNVHLGTDQAVSFPHWIITFLGGF